MNGSPSSKTNWVTLTDFKFLCFNLACELFGHFEPIPPFENADIRKLEASLMAPQQTFGGEPLYPSLVEQAAALFYFLIKNHPFENGNKRIALTTLLMFLTMNGKWLKTASLNLYVLPTEVAESNPKNKDAVLKSLQQFVRKSLIDSPKRGE
jgi:death-on-curing family protein